MAAKYKIVAFSSLAYACVLTIVLLTLIQSIGGWRYIYFKVTQDVGATATKVARAEVFDVCPIRKEAIIFLGDSITAQAEWHELLPKQAVLNRGISGDTVHGIKERVGSLLAAKPKKIFLMVGINDLIMTNDPNLTAERIKNLLLHIENNCSQTELIVQGLLPVNNNISRFWTAPENIFYVNDFLKSYCDSREIEFVDTASYFIGPSKQLLSKYSYDGLHLNGVGYMKWKTILEPYL